MFSVLRLIDTGLVTMKGIFHLLLVLSCFFCFTACNTAPPKPKPPALTTAQLWNTMVGTWYSSHTLSTGETQQEIVEKKKDGTYRSTQRLYSSTGQFKEKTEVGQWGLSGNIYFMIHRGKLTNRSVKPYDTSNPNYYQAYKILDAKPNAIRHSHVATGKISINTKVSSNFKFPGLRVISKQVN